MGSTKVSGAEIVVVKFCKELTDVTFSTRELSEAELSISDDVNS
jgi:hypothetical protein